MRRKREEKKRRREEEGRRKKRSRRKSRFGIHVWNFGLEHLFCLEYFFRCGKYGTYVWICWLGNYPNSFFVYVGVRKTLTLQHMCIFSWFSFG